ncbi:hypothetical protein JHW43_001317 [Diplocarpon mali]|nr:hypothetical protein JHW43_001317 [Diplocarpon mali]
MPAALQFVGYSYSSVASTVAEKSSGTIAETRLRTSGSILHGRDWCQLDSRRADPHAGVSTRNGSIGKITEVPDSNPGHESLNPDFHSTVIAQLRVQPLQACSLSMNPPPTLNVESACPSPHHSRGFLSGGGLQFLNFDIFLSCFRGSPYTPTILTTHPSLSRVWAKQSTAG